MNSITCFKAYDLRGRIPNELNDDVAYQVARGYAQFLKPKTHRGGPRHPLEQRSVSPMPCAAV